MPKLALILLIISTALFSNAQSNCTVSPKAMLSVPGKKLPFSWSDKSPIVRSFQDIGYTAGPLKTSLAPGEKEANLSLFCGGERTWDGIVYACAAALIISENQNGTIVKIASAAMQKAVDGVSLEDAINKAAKAATKLVPRCESK